MKCTLFKTDTGGERVRTDVVDGHADRFPEVGRSFRMTAEPLDETKDFRLIETSWVVAVEETYYGVFQFETETGSIYVVEFGRVEE